MPSIGPAEVLVILVLALLIFGPQKMPEIGRQVGRAMREFRKAQSAVRTELRDALDITGGGVTGTHAPPPSYADPAPTAPTAPTTETTEPTVDGAAPAADAPAAPVASAGEDDNADPAVGRGLGAASHPVVSAAASAAATDAAAADADEDPAFGRRAGAPVEPR
jgi:sec-independent protein translocase protein TatA